jgi:SAM-dependent methyltransferase
MQRSRNLEVMDRPDLPEHVMVRVHRQLTLVNRLLGNTAALVEAVQRDPEPTRRVLDIGCGYGGVLLNMRSRLAVEVVGVDLRVPAYDDCPFPIIRADAVLDPLPEADVAVSALLAHHLSGDDLVRLIQNVGRSCRRFVLLDLVRSRLPLILFRSLVAPLLTPLTASDGDLSIRRAYTEKELSILTRRSLGDTGGTFRHSIAPLKIRQVIDISYRRSDKEAFLERKP